MMFRDVEASCDESTLVQNPKVNSKRPGMLRSLKSGKKMRTNKKKTRIETIELEYESKEAEKIIKTEGN